MKDNSLDGHRGKVAVTGTGCKPDLKAEAAGGTVATNFDDDYNEWELGIGDLIIDLDADIEKNNDKNCQQPNGGAAAAAGVTAAGSGGTGVSLGLLSAQGAGVTVMSKSSRTAAGPGSTNSTTGTTIEHQATVDKGLKMKIKRKNVGSRSSEAKHEIVQSDTKSSPHHSSSVGNSSSSVQSSTVVDSNSNLNQASGEPRSKHSSSKGRSGSHRDKKDKKDKGTGKSVSVEVNGVVGSSLKITNSGISISTGNQQTSGPTPPPPPPPPPVVPNSNSSSVCPPVSTSSSTVPTVAVSVSSSSTSSSTLSLSSSTTLSSPSPPSSTSAPLPSTLANADPPNPLASSPVAPSLTVKLDTKFSTAVSVPTAVIKTEEDSSPPPKRIKVEKQERVESACSPIPPEMKDTSICTSVGTITEPDCLGPCEPGTSVQLEGIVWQETEGGVLVVNVTWRGKTYVGTLLDCTKHDWAPPRFCESPTSDIDAKASKGRGKRGGRGSNSMPAESPSYDSRSNIHSKLRNGKGRRTANSSGSNAGFTVPSSPVKTEPGTAGNSKRKGKPTELELSPVETKGNKRSRTQSRNTPTPSSSSSSGNNSGSNSSGTEPSQPPSSPVLIECPEPNCNKKYKHINGLRYHQTHAHSGQDSKPSDESTEDRNVNSSDYEESAQEGPSVPPSPVTPSPHPTRTPQLEDTASTPPAVSGESDNFCVASDLSTLATVAISDSKNSGLKTSPLVRFGSPGVTPISATSDSVTTSESEGPSMSSCVCTTLTTTTTTVTSSMPPPPLPAASVIHSAGSGAVVTPVSSVPSSVPSGVSVTVSIPTSQVFSFGQPVPNRSTSAPVTVVSSLPVTVSSVRPLSSSISGQTFMTPPTGAALQPNAVPISISVDKTKIKQEKTPDKHKPKSPGSTPSPGVRPIVPAPSAQVLTLAANIPSNHNTMAPGAHSIITSSLKPIQPKPTILGEPTTINPALESLKKEKSKHKKKSKDRDKEKRPGSHVDGKPIGLVPGEGERSDNLAYQNVEGISGSRDALGNPIGVSSSQHRASLSPLAAGQSLETPLEINTTDGANIENVQSPAYSDISDANDTAPILESEIQSNSKEKEEKEPKTPAEPTSQASDLRPYGMYPYYSQPPYLLPSVPQNSISQTSGTPDKAEQKKQDVDKNKDQRNWPNQPLEPGKERNPEQEQPEKKREGTPSANVPTAAAPSGPIPDYPLQQYSYPYGYVQGYPYDPTYHMHLLASDPHYKHYMEEHERLYKEQAERQQGQQSSVSKDERGRDSKERSSLSEKSVLTQGSTNPGIPEHSSKQHSNSVLQLTKDRDREKSIPGPHQSRLESSVPSSAASSVSISLKEKQNENHQILKENIELKSQMDANKNKFLPYDQLLYDQRRYYFLQERLQERLMEQQKFESEQAPQSQQHSQQMQQSQSVDALHKDDLLNQIPVFSKPSSLNEASRISSVISSPKPDLVKTSSASRTTSSPKTSLRESSVSSAKDFTSTSTCNTNVNTAGNSSRKEGSHHSVKQSDDGRDEKSSKSEKKPQHSEGQKPTMETTGPPPPPTSSIAYLHPSYLQPPPSHFPHMPFDSMYRSGLNPMLMSTPPPYGSSPYFHPPLRFPVPPEIPPHTQATPVDPLGHKLHAPGPPKALDLLHQVSQHYSSHKIHELQECAVMSPGPNAIPASSSGSTPTQCKVSNSTTSSSESSSSSTSKPLEASSSSTSTSTSGSNNTNSNPNDRSRSPPPQRHLHTHHHTHVGVGYPLYDPYGGKNICIDKTKQKVEVSNPLMYQNSPICNDLHGIVPQTPWKQTQPQRRVPYRIMQ